MGFRDNKLANKWEGPDGNVFGTSLRRNSRNVVCNSLRRYKQTEERFFMDVFKLTLSYFALNYHHPFTKEDFHINKPETGAVP
jgi:hypothetical protein